MGLVTLGGGGAKLAGVPEVHQSFSLMGLPAWFGYFIGACEVAGAIGIWIRPLSALAAAGIAIIMLGANYFHVVHTPIAQTIPALVILLICIYIFRTRRGDMLHSLRS